MNFSGGFFLLLFWMNWVIVIIIHFSPSSDFFLPVMTFFLPAIPFSPTKEVDAPPGL